MIKLDIINQVVSQTGLAKNKAGMAVEAVFEGIKEALTRGERIELRGFAIFEVRPRKTGIARNPRRNVEVLIRPVTASRSASLLKKGDSKEPALCCVAAVSSELTVGWAGPPAVLTKAANSACLRAKYPKILLSSSTRLAWRGETVSFVMSAMDSAQSSDRSAFVDCVEVTTTVSSHCLHSDAPTRPASTTWSRKCRTFARSIPGRKGSRELAISVSFSFETLGVESTSGSELHLIGQSQVGLPQRRWSSPT